MGNGGAPADLVPYRQGLAGNFRPPSGDLENVKCEIAREALSATLDGEDPGVESALLDAHLAGCAACTAWYEKAARVDRLSRIAPVAAPEVAVEDLVTRVLAQVALPRRSRWRRALTLALGVVAVAQLVIGVVTLFFPLGMAMGGMAHMDHETTAFNLAFGVILLLVTLNGHRARTMIPVLATFVGVHAIASMFDLAAGAVGLAHLATHLPIAVGLILVVAIGRNRRPDPGLGTANTPEPTGDAHTDLSRSGPAVSSHRPRPAPPAASRRAG